MPNQHLSQFIFHTVNYQIESCKDEVTTLFF
nr:MAG TPA: hypothetical protein [Caudoviricetes sp.]